MKEFQLLFPVFLWTLHGNHAIELIIYFSELRSSHGTQTKENPSRHFLISNQKFGFHSRRARTQRQLDKRRIQKKKRVAKKKKEGNWQVSNISLLPPFYIHINRHGAVSQLGPVQYRFFYKKFKKHVSPKTLFISNDLLFINDFSPTIVRVHSTGVKWCEVYSYTYSSSWQHKYMVVSHVCTVRRISYSPPVLGFFLALSCLGTAAFH